VPILGELLTLQWRDVSFSRNEITLRAEKTKDREHRTVPVSTRLRGVLEMVKNDPDGKPFSSLSYVFGNEVGGAVGSIKRAWQTTVLRANGHKPVWIWKKKLGPNDKGTTKLSPESQAAYRAVDLHFHDLRHEAASRLLEGRWPLHHVQQMLGHASIKQTSTYLNATLGGLHQSMRDMEDASAVCNPVANPPELAPQPDCKQAPARDGNVLIH
jgi:integrase